MPSRQALWQAKQRSSGRCMICGKKRGKDGTATYCRKHQDDYNARRRKAANQS